MIIRADNRTTQIKLALSDGGKPLCCDDIQLEISPLVCERSKPYKWFNFCSTFIYKEVEPQPEVTLIYDAFGRDENGRVQFPLDGNFYSLPCGRYNAKVIICGCYLTTFQIDKQDRRKVQKVTIESDTSCCGGEDGC